MKKMVVFCPGCKVKKEVLEVEDKVFKSQYHCPDCGQTWHEESTGQILGHSAAKVTFGAALGFVVGALFHAFTGNNNQNKGNKFW